MMIAGGVHDHIGALIRCQHFESLDIRVVTEHFQRVDNAHGLTYEFQSCLANISNNWTSTRHLHELKCRQSDRSSTDDQNVFTLADGGSVDGVTCGFALRNLLELPAFFEELARVVRPGGRIALLDVGIPKNKVIRFGNNIYFGKVVPKIGALLSDGAAYRYLPKSVAYLPQPAEMVAMLRAAGFSDASHHLLSGGLTQQLLGTRD